MKRFRPIHNTISVIAYAVATITVLVVLFSAFAGYIHPRRSSLLPVAALALPYVAAVAVLVLLSLALFRQKYPALMVAVALIVSWGSIRLVCPINLLADSVDDEDKTFTLMSFNVRNFGIYDGMQKEINPNLRYILDVYPDVAVLQEASLTKYNYETINSVQPLLKELNEKYPYRSHGWHDVIILSKYPYKFVEDELKWRDIEHGYDSASDHRRYYGKVFDVFAGNDTVRVIGVHLMSIGLSQDDKEAYVDITHVKDVKGLKENKDNLKQFRSSILSKLQNAARLRALQARTLRDVIDRSHGKVILCGDFNDAPGSYSYRTIKGSDMSDAFVECGLGPITTYNEHRLFFKIDHVLFKGDMEATSSVREKAGDSDHYPQTVVFKLK